MKHLLYILPVIILTSCTTIDVRRTLNDVETYIAERPDSALSVLESIDTTSLTTKGLRAHHALLHAMALDKNYIDVTDDSLALKAVNYYQKRGPRKNYVRSLYYLALSYFRNEQYEESMNYLSMAEQVAEKYDSLYLGFVKVLQSDAYSKNYNNLEELACLEEALQVYIDIGADYYVDVATLGLATSYANNEKFNDAKSLFEELLSSGNLNKRMSIKAMRNYAFMLATCPESDFSLSSAYYQKVESEDEGRYMSAQDYWVWAYALSEMGEYERSHEIVDVMRLVDSSATACHFMYMIAKNEGDTEKALDYLEQFCDRNNDEVVQILKQSISGIQKDFYQSQYEIADFKAANRLLVMICIITAAILLIAISAILLIRYRRKKEQEKEQYIRYAEEVNRQLRDFKLNTYSLSQKKYISIYKSKYETLGTLFDQYIQSGGRIDSERIVYKKVVSLIDELRGEIENSEDFEAMLDADLDGIMTKLHTELPDLKKKDFSLFGYLALGFDATIISHFMDCTVNTIYIRKSRLKKAIEESDADHKQLFMEVIS